MPATFFARLRTVTESHAVSQEVDAARRQFDRFDDAWEGLKWLLSRKPESLGTASSRGADTIRLYVQDSDEISGAPQIWILFRFDAEAVEVLAINIVPFDNDAEKDN